MWKTVVVCSWSSATRLVAVERTYSTARERASHSTAALTARRNTIRTAASNPDGGPRRDTRRAAGRSRRLMRTGDIGGGPSAGQERGALEPLPRRSNERRE